MCGIAGFTHAKSSTSRERIQEALACMIHRGPDQQGFFQSDSVALGAARLKILDLQTGNQPIVSRDGDVVIAFNGEIYNHLELRRELEQLGHSFTTHTDTETVLEAFLEWDCDCFHRLRGMFAIALWRESEKRLVLARDRLGIKPLYLARKGRELYFGSELKTLFVHPQIERNLDLRGLDCYLAVNYVPAPWTLVEGIEKLSPGHWLEWVNGRVRSRSYWELPLRPSAHRSAESAAEELDSLLEESVREHLLSDVPLAVWLSGGIDSSTILHYATKVSGRALKTFSISFAGRSFDESAYIREVASAYGTEHEQLDLNTDLCLRDAIEELAYYADDPNADAGALPVWYLSKLTKKGATVALSGEGADELFGGYLTYRADQLANWFRRLPSRLLDAGACYATHLPVSDEKIGLEYKLKRFLQGSRMPPERAHVFWNGTFSDEEKERITQQPLPSAFHRLLGEARAAGNDLKAHLWFDQKYFLPDDILAKVDRMSMAHSLEVRPPFLDHRLVEFAASLPSKLLLRSNRQKIILKTVMKDKLPPMVLRRKKTGFDIPAHEWLRGPLRQFLLDVIETGLREHPELFRRRAIEDCLDRHFKKVENLGYHLWGLMTLFLWMRRWKIQSAPVMQSQERFSGGLVTPF